MPTVKQRIQVTETQELSQALEIARELWPNESKSAQVALLAQRGAESVIEERFAMALQRRTAIEEIRALHGSLLEGVTKDDLRKLWERDDS